MALDLRGQQNSKDTAARRCVTESLDATAVEKACADLCAKLGRNVPAGTATLKVFGVMAARAESINHTHFNLGHANPDLSTVPLPFSIDKNQEVMLLVDCDEMAVRTSYARAVSLFKDIEISNEASILVAASNLEWAIVVNEDGGVVYWQEKTRSALDALSIPPATE